MSYHVHVTINTPAREFEITFPDASSLDKTIELVRDIHPNATSFVFAIVPNQTET